VVLVLFSLFTRGKHHRVLTFIYIHSQIPRSWCFYPFYLEVDRMIVSFLWLQPCQPSYGYFTLFCKSLPLLVDRCFLQKTVSSTAIPKQFSLKFNTYNVLVRCNILNKAIIPFI